MKCEFTIGKYTLESLTNGMYASPLDMYREYIQNAVDSLDETAKPGSETAEKLFVEITIDKANRRVVIRDNGHGLQTADAEAALLDIGNSSKRRDAARGFRGIGRLAGLSCCERLTFRTSYCGEETATIISFDAALLKNLLLPGNYENMRIEDVIEEIVTVHTEREDANQRYFQVELQGVWNGAGLLNLEAVEDYLLQHAPLRFSEEFKWGQLIEEKMRLEGCPISQYDIRLNGKTLYKPYRDTFVSDRVKKNIDSIRDVKVKAFYRGKTLSAFLWYAETNFYGTILDNAVKGLRIRQGNILIGDKSSCNSLFKEERFNGWMIGELHVADMEMVANSRRDGFEKNAAYFELFDSWKGWALEVSREIRNLSYERNLSSSKKAVVEADHLEDISDENALCSENLAYAEEYGESAVVEQDESTELAEADYISKLSLLLEQKKSQTKYAALNVNPKLTIEQRKALERVFDLITQSYERDEAERFVSLIAEKF